MQTHGMIKIATAVVAWLILGPMLLLTSCDTTPPVHHSPNDNLGITMESNQPRAGVALKEKAHASEWYRAADFNLVTGTIIKFAPSDDYMGGITEAQRKQTDIYVHIKLDDGSIKVMRCTYETWLNLSDGDVLR